MRRAESANVVLNPGQGLNCRITESASQAPVEADDRRTTFNQIDQSYAATVQILQPERRSEMPSADSAFRCLNCGTVFLGWARCRKFRRWGVRSLKDRLHLRQRHPRGYIASS